MEAAFSKIQRATSSPSRPASVAITKEPTSGLCNNFFTTLYCLLVSGMTFNSIFSGSIGRVSMLQVLYCSPYASGSASSTRCPNAHVTIYCPPDRYPCRPACIRAPAPALFRQTVFRQYQCLCHRLNPHSFSIILLWKHTPSISPHTFQGCNESFSRCA